jgi:hypothetical protein|tara:strand:- start:58 stop:447 length:390 start_codon:yes stop_codon:yes gene_type:complete
MTIYIIEKLIVKVRKKMLKSSKIKQIAIDKASNLCYNDIMKNNNTSTKENKMIEQVTKISGYTFTFTPSLRCLGVQSPTGGLEIIHVGVGNSRKEESEKANEIAMGILSRKDVTKAGLSTNPLNVAGRK